MSNKQIDPRGPRFGAAITTVLLAIDVYLALDPKTFPKEREHQYHRQYHRQGLF
jgi:hypothetical protein